MSQRAPQAASPSHWAAMGESTFVAGIWLLYWVQRLVGRGLFRICLAPVLLLHWLCRPALRSASLGYLARLKAFAPQLPIEANWRHGLRHVALFAETMLDKLLAMANRYPRELVQEQGVALMRAHLAAGQGGVFVTAHMGCLELSRVVADGRAALRLLVLVHTQHAQQFNAILHRLNPDARFNLLEVTDINPATAARLAEWVDGGGWVAIAGDRVPVQSQQTVEVEFLGHAAPFPLGPYVLGTLLKCPLVAMTCTHQGAGYVLQFEQLCERVSLPRATRQAALQAHAQVFARLLERRLVEAPFDWFNFYPFWDTPRAAPPR